MASWSHTPYSSRTERMSIDGLMKPSLVLESHCAVLTSSALKRA